MEDVNDDRLAVQLNVLDELEWANEGELPAPDVVSDVVQVEFAAHAAWTKEAPKERAKANVTKVTRREVTAQAILLSGKVDVVCPSKNERRDYRN